MATSKSGLLVVDDEPSIRTSLSLMPPIPVCSSVPKITTESNDSADIPIIDVALWRGLLLIEPDMDVLSAEALLLTNSNYSVTTAFSQRGIFILRDTATVALAVISDALGSDLLNAAAKTVRRQWPLARILVLGRAESVLEDHLYDEQVDHSLDPQQLLDDLERLYNGSWNQRSHTLDWNVGRAGKCAVKSSVKGGVKVGQWMGMKLLSMPPARSERAGLGHTHPVQRHLNGLGGLKIPPHIDAKKLLSLATTSSSISRDS